MRDYSIGRLAAETGVKIPTIRYYESIGLIDPPLRTAGNQRRYGAAALARLRFVAHARDMGFPMDTLRSLLQLAGHGEAPCADVDALTRQHLADVEARIARLTRLRTELEAMLHSNRHGTVKQCRILEVLGDHEECATEH